MVNLAWGLWALLVWAACVGGSAAISLLQSMALQPAAGVRDLNPGEVEQNRSICAQLSSVYRRWGYQQLTPPSVERSDTLEAGGAINEREIVRLVSGEPLGLRPELTAPILGRPVRGWPPSRDRCASGARARSSAAGLGRGEPSASRNSCKVAWNSSASPPRQRKQSCCGCCWRRWAAWASTSGTAPGCCWATTAY